MATTMKKTTPRKTTAPKTEKVAEQVVTEESVKKTTKKKYSADTEIMCKSIAAGKTFVPGPRTHKTYVFEAENVSRPIEYQDLEAMAVSGSNYLFKPFIIVDDEDFVNKFPKLKSVYDAMYSANDLSRILSLSPEEVARIVPKLPMGAKEAIKNVASGMIADGSLNDVRVIKVLDKELDTQLMLMTGLYN